MPRCFAAKYHTKESKLKLLLFYFVSKIIFGICAVPTVQRVFKQLEYETKQTVFKKECFN